MSVVGDILRSYRAPRQVMRKHLAGPRREDRALAWLLGACLLIFVAQWPRLARQAHLDDSIPLPGLLAGALFGWMFLAPLILYALAALLQLGARLAGRGAADHYAMRVVTFWSLLASSPVWLVQGMVAGLAGPGGIGAVAGLAVVAAVAIFIGAGLREAALEPPAASA